MHTGTLCIALIVAALLIAAAILLSHPDALTAWRALPYREAQDAVRADLYRPETAQFRGMSVHQGTYCGEENAYNRLGYAIGFQPFSASQVAGRWFVYMVPGDANAHERVVILKLIAGLCGQHAPGTGAAS